MALQAASEHNVVDGCPAFTEGCPFSGIDMSSLPQIVDALPKGLADKCVAFQDGCPFRGSDSVEALYNRLSEMPVSHRVGMDSAAAKTVEDVLHMVHDQSKAMKAKLNLQCPVFATSCPFKTVTSDGAPLVQELDNILEAWGLSEEEPLVHSAPKEEVHGPVEPLSKSLKAGTKTVHRAAENVHFVRDFLSGAVPKSSYIEFLFALHPVYDALECALDSLPLKLRHADFAVLRRAQTLMADLRYYLNLSNSEALPIMPPSLAAQQYIQHLQDLAKHRPLMLLAHAYTRYLGDLSGGQILARAAAKAYGLPTDGRGASFYRFEGIGESAQDLKAFKRSYRASLDELRLGAEEADALVEEANVAFLMNMSLFEERDVAAGYLQRVRSLEEVMALVRQHTTALGFQRAYKGEAAPAKKNVCPFMPVSVKNGDAPVAAPPRGALMACPWPFLWFHDPHAALVAHPAKNLGGVAALGGLAAAAWHCPRSTCVGLAGAGALALVLKHRGHWCPMIDMR